MRKTAASLQKDDRGNALGEAASFVTLEAHLHGGTDAATRSSMTQFFREGYSAGYTLGYALYQSLVIPDRLIRRREPNS